MPARRLPRLQAVPTEDLAFRRFVADAFARLLGDPDMPADGLPDPADLQARLRSRYPSAVVREEAPSAARQHETVWAVYRFGSVVPGRRWWEEPGHAWAILDRDRLFVEVSTALAEMVEVPRDALVGQPVERLSNPDDVSAVDDVRGLWGELLAGGELHGTLRFRHLDGSPREIEYHVTRDAAGPGRHLAIVREIEPTRAP
jgi:PAS domain-containing protein